MYNPYSQKIWSITVSSILPVCLFLLFLAVCNNAHAKAISINGLSFSSLNQTSYSKLIEAAKKRYPDADRSKWIKLRDEDYEQLKAEMVDSHPLALASLDPILVLEVNGRPQSFEQFVQITERYAESPNPIRLKVGYLNYTSQDYYESTINLYRASDEITISDNINGLTLTQMRIDRAVPELDFDFESHGAPEFVVRVDDVEWDSYHYHAGFRSGDYILFGKDAPFEPYSTYRMKWDSIRRQPGYENYVHRVWVYRPSEKSALETAIAPNTEVEKNAVSGGWRGIPEDETELSGGWKLYSYKNVRPAPTSSGDRYVLRRTLCRVEKFIKQNVGLALETNDVLEDGRYIIEFVVDKFPFEKLDGAIAHISLNKDTTVKWTRKGGYLWTRTLFGKINFPQIRRANSVTFSLAENENAKPIFKQFPMKGSSSALDALLGCLDK